MDMTWSELLSLTLKDSGAFGIGQSPLAQYVQDAQKRLNMMLGQWRAKSWLVFQHKTLEKASTGASSYTVGPSGDFDTPVRPPKLAGAYVRVAGGSTPVDFPLQVLQSMQDYGAIPIKELRSLPTHVYYDPGVPLGTVRFWPVAPSSLYTMFLIVRSPIEGISDTLMGEQTGLPDEYHAAIYYNMIVRNYAAFRLPPDPIVIGLAKDALNTIRTANAQIPELIMPQRLSFGQSYNVYSDQVR